METHLKWGVGGTLKRGTILLILAAFCRAGAAEVPGAAATVTNAPSAPSLSDLPRLKSVSQYGITWTFQQPAPVGQFVNGDFYVVGRVAVTNIDPRPLLGDQVPQTEICQAERNRRPDGKYIRNGSMLNPPAREEVAFDSGIMNYCNPDLLEFAPVPLKPGDCLVSTISLKVGKKADFPYHSEGGREQGDNSPIKTLAILTCVAEPLPSDAFRPSYGDRRQKIYYAHNLRKNLLRRLPLPANAPNLLTWIRVFQRPWFNTCFFGFEEPMENMPHYGQWVAEAQSVGGLMLMLDYNSENKERLLINMVQVGIDYWGLVQNGHPGWQGWGGHGSGRKFPIVLAGILLGDDAMACPTKTYPKVEFGEDNQTMYGEGWTGAKALFAGHSGIQSATGKAERPKWGPYENLPPSKWTKDNFTSEAYRRVNSSSAWIGEALVIRMLHAETNWNHDAFFDYMDRWMTEDDNEPGRIIMQSWPDMHLNDQDKWNREGYSWEPFVKTMWFLYRHNLDQK
ncbi:MAG TPA: hypothetical protein VG146_13900 [Verrucomicrobiae bacterium]|nr:hypothetical protein [Verrucomicrobiae bacterium]